MHLKYVTEDNVYETIFGHTNRSLLCEPLRTLYKQGNLITSMHKQGLSSSLIRYQLRHYGELSIGTSTHK